MTKEIGKIIRTEIEKKGSILAFSKQIKINRGTLYSILEGKTYNIKFLIKTLKELNLKIEITKNKE